MKTLIEHFNEMTNNIEIIEEQLELVYQKMVELNIDELKSSRQKGGEIVGNEDIIKCEDNIEEFTLRDKMYKICVRKI